MRASLNFGLAILIIFFSAVSSATFGDESSGKAFLGLGFVDANGGDIDPIPLGVDYRFGLDNDFFQTNDLRMLAGILYWSESISVVDFSVLELTTGIEKVVDMDDFFINFGSRVGFASLSVEGGGASDSETKLMIAPFGEILYPINYNMAVSGELRIPMYFGADYFDFMDIVYLLFGFNYIF